MYVSTDASTVSNEDGEMFCKVLEDINEEESHYGLSFLNATKAFIKPYFNQLQPRLTGANQDIYDRRVYMIAESWLNHLFSGRTHFHYYTFDAIQNRRVRATKTIDVELKGMSQCTVRYFFIIIFDFSDQQQDIGNSQE